ncbi:hypothetical protein ACH3VR_17995 [Microbacterium sp. B2969]|uniref:Uncharacterized protein n=1 Tax=Microbacterium alkaliflavum TaxID=3248839 RepID=A0ABW7QBJ8_9MICO
MSKSRTHHRREEAVDPSQQPGYAPNRRFGGDSDDYRRAAGKGYIPVRSYRIPADRHE